MNKNRPVLLVVDDEQLNHVVVSEFLADENYELIFVDGGEEAWSKLRAEPERYDAVLLDRMMPVVDGIEVLRRMKDDPELGMIPVIMLTAAAEPDQVAEGIKAGCFYYLTKPFARTVLCQVLAAAIRDRNYRIGMQTGLMKFREAIEKEISKTHQATLMAAYHYLNNALNQFQLVLMQLEIKGSVDDAVLQAIKASMKKTAEEMREFGQLEHPTRENVEKFIKDRL